MNAGLSILGICLAAGIGAAGWFASQTIVNGRVAVNTATVKGLAEREVPADRATWTVFLRSAARAKGNPDLPALYARIEAQQAAVLAVFKEAGFPEAEVSPAPFSYGENANYDRDGDYLDTTYEVSGRVDVTSTDLARVTKAHFAMAELPRQGLAIRFDAPEYHFTGLNALKPDMLREATKNARLAADEFARDAGVSVGGIQDATQGGFSIRDVGSEYDETHALQKTVRVVTTITFYLDN